MLVAGVISDALSRVCWLVGFLAPTSAEMLLPQEIEKSATWIIDENWANPYTGESVLERLSPKARQNPNTDTVGVEELEGEGLVCVGYV